MRIVEWSNESEFEEKTRGKFPKKFSTIYFVNLEPIRCLPSPTPPKLNRTLSYVIDECEICDWGEKWSVKQLNIRGNHSNMIFNSTHCRVCVLLVIIFDIVDVTKIQTSIRNSGALKSTPAGIISMKASFSLTNGFFSIRCHTMCDCRNVQVCVWIGGLTLRLRLGAMRSVGQRLINGCPTGSWRTVDEQLSNRKLMNSWWAAEQRSNGFVA